MKIKKAANTSLIIIAVLLVSVIFGFIFQKVYDGIERKEYPLEYKDFVEKYSYEYGVQKSVIYAVIKCESDFDSSLLSPDGKIGLMQVEPETLDRYKEELHDSYDTGMLYDPETNIKYGTYKLSKMYLRLGTWRSVFAALASDEDTVAIWLENEEYAEISDKAKPKLVNIPDKEVKKSTGKYEEVSEKYNYLYFNN